MTYIQAAMNSSKAANLQLRTEIIKPTEFHPNAFISFWDEISGQTETQGWLFHLYASYLCNECLIIASQDNSQRSTKWRRYHIWHTSHSSTRPTVVVEWCRTRFVTCDVIGSVIDKTAGEWWHKRRIRTKWKTHFYELSRSTVWGKQLTALKVQGNEVNRVQVVWIERQVTCEVPRSKQKSRYHIENRRASDI
jgi:hypothetical protein